MSDDQTKNSFSMRVEIHAKDNDLLLISSLASLCEDYGISASSASTFINRGLKEKIQIEAENMKTIRPESAVRPTLFIE